MQINGQSSTCKWLLLLLWCQGDSVYNLLITAYQKIIEVITPHESYYALLRMSHKRW